jgi:hypothetical protein
MTNPCALRRALVAAAACFRRNVGRCTATQGQGMAIGQTTRRSLNLWYFYLCILISHPPSSSYIKVQGIL